jgi:hypothetical protein
MNNALYLRLYLRAKLQLETGLNASLSYHLKPIQEKYAVGLTYQKATVEVDPFIAPQD